MCSLAKMVPRKLLNLDSLKLRVELGLKHFAADYLGFVQLEVMANQIFGMVTACISRIMKNHQRHQGSFEDASLTFYVQFDRQVFVNEAMDMIVRLAEELRSEQFDPEGSSLSVPLM